MRKAAGTQGHTQAEPGQGSRLGLLSVPGLSVLSALTSGQPVKEVFETDTLLFAAFFVM